MTTLPCFVMLSVLVFLFLAAAAHSQEKGTVERSSNKGAICTLAMGKSNLQKYRNLIKHHIAIERFVWFKGADVVIFHEGDIIYDHQEYIRSKTPNLPLKFINVSDTFQLYKEVNNSFCPQTPKVVQFGPGYRSMSRFWFSEFQNYLPEYDWAFRIDEDCFAMSHISQFLSDNDLTSKVRVSATLWIDLSTANTDHIDKFRDGPFTWNLKQLVRNFAVKYSLPEEMRTVESWSAPYTNVVFINLNWYRSTKLLMYFDREVLDSQCIYSGRWGDLPLWGAKVFLTDESSHLLNFTYQHLSHRVKVRAFKPAKAYSRTFS